MAAAPRGSSRTAAPSLMARMRRAGAFAAPSKAQPRPKRARDDAETPAPEAKRPRTQAPCQAARSPSRGAAQEICSQQSGAAAVPSSSAVAPVSLQSDDASLAAPPTAQVQVSETFTASATDTKETLPTQSKLDLDLLVDPADALAILGAGGGESAMLNISSASSAQLLPPRPTLPPGFRSGSQRQRRRQRAAFDDGDEEEDTSEGSESDEEAVYTVEDGKKVAHESVRDFVTYDSDAEGELAADASQDSAAVTATNIIEGKRTRRPPTRYAPSIDEDVEFEDDNDEDDETSESDPPTDDE